MQHMVPMPNLRFQVPSDRVNKQCLVESLGSRQCLVYKDSENKLYQGADTRVLLERIERASTALATIPELASAKCWTKVLGVMTGPMGTLGRKMDQLSKLSSDPAKVGAFAKKVKTDLYAIAAAAEKKSVEMPLQAHEQATADLVVFVNAIS